MIGMLMMFAAVAVPAGFAETYTGTVLSYGQGLSTRTRTSTFTLTINQQSSAADAQRFLNILEEGGQDALLRAMGNGNLGRFSVGPRVGVDLDFVQESMVNGKKRIFIVFERWTHFAELRYGLRSQDYPFGVIELFIDPATGKGEGTYIAAARIEWEKENGEYVVEVENFATWPARLMGVTLRNGRG